MSLVYIPGTPLERISSSKEGNSQPPSSSTNSPLDELWQSIHCSYGTVHLLLLFCCWVDRKGPSKAHLVRAEIDDQYYVVLVPSSPLLQFYGPTVLFFPKCKEWWKRLQGPTPAFCRFPARPRRLTLPACRARPQLGAYV